MRITTSEGQETPRRCGHHEDSIYFDAPKNW
jgi:hypothetical protein